MFRRFLPRVDDIRHSRMLRWAGPRLHDPALWSLERASAARGIAIGAFFGLMIPIAQIPAAALCSLFLRGNIWLASCATLISNPLTYGPLGYLAYRIGAFFLYGATPEPTLPPDGNWMSRLGDIGLPLITGMLVMALTAAVTGYLLTHLFWWLRQRLKRPLSHE